MFKMFQWVQVSETDQVAVLHILTKIDISQTWHNTSRKNLKSNNSRLNLCTINYRTAPFIRL